MKKICLKKGITMLLIPGLILSLASCKAEGNSGFGSGLGAPLREEGSTAEQGGSTVRGDSGNGTENRGDAVQGDNGNGTESRGDAVPGSEVNGTENREGTVQGSEVNGTENREDTVPGSEVNGTENRENTVQGSEVNGTENSSQAAGSSGALTLLYHLQRGDTDCTTDAGYYYLSDNVERLTDGRNARHLMYIDFAAGQEIYLCSNAACSHNTADCTSVFPLEEFPQSSILFTWNGSLYLMSKEFDNDGSVMMGASGGENSAAESKPAVLYRMDLDGTNREKLYTFDPAVTVEDLAAADSGGLYFVTKKLSTEQNGGNAYRTASERNLIYLDSAGKKETVVCSMDFGDNISWDVVGCSGRSLILYGIDFSRSVSAEEMHGDDSNELYDSSYDVFAALNADTCALTEIYRVYAPRARSYALDADRLYFSVSGEGRILSVNLQDGRQETLCSIQQDDIWGIVGDKLYTRDSRDRTYYFIDVNTGKISHSGLVEKTIGSSLDILAEAGDRVLAIYAIDAVPKGDGSYTVNGYRYGLIDKEDLYAGRDRFTAVKMIGNGR